MQKDWSQCGGNQFEFIILEEVKKGESQTTKEFKEEIELLKELWIEKLSAKEFY